MKSELRIERQRDALVEAIRRHQETLDGYSLNGYKRDRDGVDNDLYNATIGPHGVAPCGQEDGDAR